MNAGSRSWGGVDQVVRYCIKDCWLGKVLIAATPKGVCAVSFGATHQRLCADLACQLPAARVELAEGDSTFMAWVEVVIAHVESPRVDLALPLDIGGSVFQQRVWAVLRDIPSGHTASYGEVAAAIGLSSASRAVGNACGANPVAVVVPCHRVVRSDGKLSGYRWGIARKRALLERDRELLQDPALGSFVGPGIKA